MRLQGQDAIRQRMSALQTKLDQRLGPRSTPPPPLTQPNAGASPSGLVGNISMGEVSGSFDQQLAGVASLRPMSISGMNLVPQGPDGLRQLIQKIAGEEGMDPALIEAVVATESAYDPNAVSPVGAQGLMQLMPATGRSLGVKDPFNPEENVRAGTRYLKQMVQQFGSLEHGLAAYNAGPGNVRRYGGIPPFKETQDYVRKVTARMQALGGTP